MEYLKNSKPWQAFKTFAIIFSFATNLLLLIVLLAAAPLILPIVNDVAKPIVSGLNESFEDMNTATIRRTIPVSDTIPVVLNVPLETVTTVVLMEEVPLSGVPARFILPGGGGVINGEVSLSLPRGLGLPVRLDLDVPIDAQLPVQLAVEAVIPLNETDLGAPFSRLQGLFAPLDALLGGLPGSNAEFFDRISGRTAVADPAPVEATSGIPTE